MYQKVILFRENFSAPYGGEKFLVYKVGTPDINDTSSAISSQIPERTVLAQTVEKTGDVNVMIKECQQKISTLKQKNMPDPKSLEFLKKAFPTMDFVQIKEGLQAVNTANKIWMEDNADVLENFNNQNRILTDKINNEGNSEEVQKMREQLVVKFLAFNLSAEAEQEKVWKKSLPDFSQKRSYKEVMEMIRSPHPKNLLVQWKNAEKLNRFPPQGSDIEPYIQWRAGDILEEHLKMKYLHKDEPFYEVIQFVDSNGTTKLSPSGLMALKQIQNPDQEEKYKQSLKSDRKKIGKLKMDSDTYGNDTTLFNQDVRKMQAKLYFKDATYQLAMMNIAHKAEAIIKQKGGMETVFSKEAIDSVKGLIAQGHYVKNEQTGKYSGRAIGSLESDKINLENLFLYEVVGTWGVVTAFANILVAIRSGNVEGALPYIALGAGTAYATKKMVFDHSLDKYREPEKMPEWIMRESGNHEYTDFFADENEMTLMNNMRWPAKKNKGTLKNMFFGNNSIYQKKKDFNTENTTTPNRAETDELKTLDPEEFEEGGMLEAYLPDTITKMDGSIVDKTTFLAEMNTLSNAEKNNLRYNMFKKTISRLGQNDSYIPYLHSLHSYAIKQKALQKNASVRNIHSPADDAKRSISQRGTQNLNPTV